MARFTFRLPDIGEGIAEAEIVAWHVAVGDRVEEDQNLADMMTDKATVEMESPVSGTIVEVAGEVGEMVPIGAALVVIETEAAEAAEAVGSDEVAEQIEAENPGVEEVVAPAQAQAQAPAPAPEKVATQSVPPVAAPHPGPLGGEREAQADSVSREHRALASPAVRARAKELGVDLSQVRAAEGDRIRHADLDAYLRYGSAQGYTSDVPRAWADESVRVIGMRRRIAENMAAAKRNIPHFTYVDEIDVTALEAMRGDLNAHRGDRPKLTLLPFLIVAMCRTLPDFPMLNARYDDEAGVVTRSGRVHCGMATQTPAGLTVPVIRDAQDRNVWQLAAEITRLAEAARAGTIRSEEMGGGTITVTSLGPLGGIATTPVINRPEVAIVGPNKIVERPVFRGDDIVRAKLMNLSISCDHRVVDGWDAASFVQALRTYLETPVLLFAS
ncbi:dihydrolipoamide acetyltransferase family protein [Sphingomonas carotinifaciens]|uniref:Dihydrolipoamide acetyltransferase component of pyruvate dehydrogenase complex n=1 Tax=Sphingomonas carotinifaciens TaxID=1166323 RepID=A0A1G7GC92_9SPHN|nr:dihydrolipoamide acetyltransferase family protein [Sphingomonas carotinifaciens]MBB4086453.1 2-oxoisovalerate dehydrogenase E2 component (dihydrolipoyl transacylase) [Sphingomonas carotinifaciens]MWC42805.1 2-oxo acid dehydrogenase subunit E2 [Sphingomonas carotinifaciens]SDE85713.1 branched-chain alpha-keto acid dehydrogenase E2 component [Sphingomonas carotinifaciens]